MFRDCRHITVTYTRARDGDKQAKGEYPCKQERQAEGGDGAE